MKLDILAFAAHPDDVELACSGTVLKHIHAGLAVGVADLTRGELGTRGTAEIRAREAAAATEIMGVKVRVNLGLEDGFFRHDKESLMRIIEVIRTYRPDIVMATAVSDRHPDHGRAARLVSEACFLSGLPKIVTRKDGQPQDAWRPASIYHYIQDYWIKPDFIVDISDFFEKKMSAIRAFPSQFYSPDSSEPETPISTKEFWDFLSARAEEMGRLIGARYGEGFTTERPPAVRLFTDLS
jgi:bacillithiol biosynthesis deacetylase BshB1